MAAQKDPEAKRALDAIVEAADAPRIHDEALSLLREIYSKLWTEAYYDPYDANTREFARPLAEKMKRVNELLGFRA